jgi:hypothetical protein
MNPRPHSMFPISVPLLRHRSPPAWRALVLAGLCVTALCSACAEVRPWERERLADPLVQGGGEPLMDRHREHVHEVREGARGATGVQGGGCGCN